VSTRRLSLLLLTGLVLILTACTSTAPSQAVRTPPATAPDPSPTPLGGASATLGSLPQQCPAGPVLTLKTISPKFGLMIGSGPAWAGGFTPYKQIPLALVWGPNDALTTHHQYGWGHKLLWVVSTHLQGAVTIRGTNLRTGTPVYPDAEYEEDSSTPTSLVLEPEDPTVVSQDTNRDDQWTQFPGTLTIPGAGCYSLEATWPGGSWHLTFAAGEVPTS
jgi:hypothetical protein